MEVSIWISLRVANSSLWGKIDPGTGVVVLNILWTLFAFLLFLIPPIYYFSRSQATFRDGILLGLVLIFSASLSIWMVNLYRTLSDANGIVYGGDIGVTGAVLMLISSTVVAVGARYFKNRESNW